MADKKIVPARWPQDLKNPEYLDREKILAIIKNVADKLANARNSDECSRFVGAVFHRYLASGGKSLDSAFGLRRRGPRVRNQKRDIDIAVAVKSRSRQQKKPDKKFLIDLGEKHGLKGEPENVQRQVEKIAKKYSDLALLSNLAGEVYKKRKNP